MKVECAYDELVELHKLQPNPRNPNKHPQKQIEMLAKIIDYQGQRAPIVVSSRSGFVTKGHGRLAALQKLGWNKAAVDFQEYDSEAQEHADMIADNKIAELADSDPLMINELALEMPEGFDFELLGIEDFNPIENNVLIEELEDEAPEVPKDTIIKLGDVIELGNHILMCGDSTSIDAVEKLMNGEKADMVFTDPPYNIDYSPEDRAIGGRARSKNKLGKIENDKMGDNDFYDFLLGLNSSLLAVASEGCAVYQCAPIGLNNLQYLRAWADSGMHYSDGLIWLKNNHSISRKDYHPKHEVIHYGWTQGSHRWYGDRNKFSVYECSREKVQDYIHPTQKPVELSAHFISNSSKMNDNILDLFGGSGSTLIACEKTNRKCFMMELDPHYCDVIVSRWLKYTNNTKVKLNGKEIDWKVDV